MSNNKGNTIVFRSMGVSEELHAAIGEIARAEDRSRHAVVKRAIDLYRQQRSETAVALK